MDIPGKPGRSCPKGLILALGWLGEGSPAARPPSIFQP